MISLKNSHTSQKSITERPTDKQMNVQNETKYKVASLKEIDRCYKNAKEL